MTLSLGGHTTVLVKDDATGAYHPQSDDSEQVQFVGSTDGAQNGQYFVVTTTDGTRYFFGRNQLPGFGTGDASTNSVWTVPVYATAAGQPCYNASFPQSWCQQAYRWNLDYVVDAHSDAVSYFYNTESNSYAADKGSTATASYIRGGYLTRIQYGQRDGQVYSTQPAAQVLFTSTGRCNQSSCDPATLTSSTAANWPDVPYDLSCATGASCLAQGPTFWSEYALASIQTQVLVGSTETNVDSWNLAHAFPATGDSDTPVLWLSSITHTGQDTTAGGSASPLALPPVTFTGTPLVNRVNLGEGYPAITRQRLTQITTESGEVISVNYSSPGCGSGTPSDASQNTSLCFPDYWTPTGQSAPVLDWFNKYIVTGVTEQDPTGGAANDTIATTYTPVGTPAWHYNDDPLTPSAQRTWDQWRGYTGMIVTTGTAPDPVQKTQYAFFRGMNGDTLPGGGTRSVTIADSRGDPPVTDAGQFAGSTFEKTVYNGANAVSDTVTDPWTSAATAAHAVSGLPTQQAFHTGTADTKVFTPLASGATRQTETDYTHDGYGRVTQTNDRGDVSTATDDLCTTTSFADNTTTWVLDKPAEVKTVSVSCSTTPQLPANAVSDKLTFYDGSTTVGAPPGAGDATMTQQATSYTNGNPAYATMSTTTVDQYGRPTAATDADSRKTTTAYTPASGAEPTKTVVTDPKGHTTTTVNDPLRELAVSSTDAAGFVTSEQYDALGRLTQVNKPGVGVALKYTYTVSNTGPSVVDTYTLNVDGTFRVAETLFDAMLRARETQTQTPDGGRTITDSVYNTNGLLSQSTDPYFNSSPVSPTLVQAQAGQIPSATGLVYDGAGRKTTAAAYALGSQTWQTSYTYGGNSVTTVPPAGSEATSTITDARGRTTDLYTFHAGVPADPINDPAADFDDVRYTYTPSGQQASMTDAAGNSWSFQYNLLNQQTSASDPDTGTTVSTYDNAGQLLTVKDARGAQTTTTYDLDGRKTAQYDTTSTQTLSSSNQIAAWAYDTARGCPAGNCIGYPTATTSYTAGDTYSQTTLDYNTQAKPQDVRTTLTGQDSTLIPAGGLVTTYGYTTTGYPTGQHDPAAGGLPPESIQIGYNNLGQPTSLAGTIPTTAGVPSWTYVQAVGYSETGQPLQYTLPAASGNIWITHTYDPQTHALTDVQTTDSNQPTVVDDTSYTYNGNGVSTGAGLVTSTVDTRNGGATTDTQCFTYDYATRLTSAWTATDNCAATPSPGSSSTVGGPSPYWQTWTYDTAGDRTSQTDHDTSGNTNADTATAYNYPAPGSSSDQPHTLTGTTATGPAAATNTATYQYDPAGNTTTITGGPTGNQSLTWNNQDKLATDTTTAGTSTYAYDTTGNLIVRRDPGTTTLFLGDEQLALNTTTGTVTGTRYYTLGGATLAARTATNANPQILVPDRQGTDQLTIDTATYTTTTRQYLPFGTTRGTTPTTWPGDNGYINGTPDTTTQLENIGAREYNPTTGRFLTPDPILETTDPNQTSGYDYAGNNPTTHNDPTGLSVFGCGPDGVLCGRPPQSGESDQEYNQTRAYWHQVVYHRAFTPSSPGWLGAEYFQPLTGPKNNSSGKMAGEMPLNHPQMDSAQGLDFGPVSDWLRQNSGPLIRTGVGILGSGASIAGNGLCAALTRGLGGAACYSGVNAFFGGESGFVASGTSNGAVTGAIIGTFAGAFGQTFSRWTAPAISWAKSYFASGEAEQDAATVAEDAGEALEEGGQLVFEGLETLAEDGILPP